RRRCGISPNGVSARCAGGMRAVIDLVCWVRTIAQSGGISAGTIQYTEQLVRFGAAVTASRIVGKRGMSWIQARVEHGNDDAFALRARAARRHSGAIPNLIGANKLRATKGRRVIQTFALD